MTNARSSRPDAAPEKSLEDNSSPPPHKPLTVRQQVLLTIRLVVGAALVIALFWIIDSAV